jgi:SAM-dependent methyltransferase
MITGRPTSPHLNRRQIVSLLAGTAVLGAAGLSHAWGESKAPPSLDVPYVPTPTDVVDKMLELARVRPDDYLIDLGCGDGRIPVTAAQRYGIKAYGVDIDPRRISEARANAKEAGVEDNVRFEVKNLFDTPISEASVLTLYLLPRINLELKPRILSELKPGTRVVSHQFDMGDWKPERTERLSHRSVYLWTVPARVEGRWRLSRNGSPNIGFELKQRFADIDGSAEIEGRPVPLTHAKVAGERVELEVTTATGERLRFEGRVIDDRIHGEDWEAVRS